MQHLKHIRYFFSITLVTVLVSGCALNSITPDTNLDITSDTALDSNPDANDVVVADSTFDMLAARDIISVLKQVEALAPERTTLGASSGAPEQSNFAYELNQELQAAGYAMRFIGEGSDSIPVSFEVQDEKLNNNSQSRTLTVFAGDVAVRRTYSIDNAGNISPLGPMQVRGADARNLVLDNNIFAAPTNDPVVEEPPTETPVVHVEQVVLEQPPAVPEVDTPLTNPGDSPLIVTPYGEAGLNVSATISGLPTDNSLLDLVAPSVPAPSQGAVDIATLRPADSTGNFMDRRQSNYANLFAEMGIVREKILTFPNDSTFMGSENKARLNAMLDDFNAQSDVLSVIGCSMGATNHVGGQEALALGRASRVRDELLYAGIPEENILDEGCWAEEAFDERMPRRGVVVTLKRRLG